MRRLRRVPELRFLPVLRLRLRRLWMRLWRRRKRPCGWRCLPVVQCAGGAPAGKPERTIDVSPLRDARYAAAGRHADSGAQDVERYQALDER